MSDMDVRIVRLEPMHVASAHALSASPEVEALEKLVSWAKPKGLTDDLKTHRVFGFNNPNPSPGSPNYGYEFWMVVDQDIEPEGEIGVKDVAGGLYAVTRVEGVQHIHAKWQDLVAWLEDSKYDGGSHQWLEEHLSPVDVAPEEMVLDLYAPIAE